MIDLLQGPRLYSAEGARSCVKPARRATIFMRRQCTWACGLGGGSSSKAAWSGEPFTHHGRFYHYENLEVWPRPEQRPHPPIWLSCSQTPSSFDWAGRMGYSILTVAYRSVETLVANNKVYRAAWAKAGHPADQWRIATHYHCVLSENKREAREIARDTALVAGVASALVVTAGAVARLMEGPHPGSTSPPPPTVPAKPEVTAPTGAPVEASRSRFEVRGLDLRHQS